MDGDTYKLYEMGYHAGDVILEIGTYGGKSAVVEILGALKRPGTPQFYGIDVDIHSIARTYETLRRFQLEDLALLYKGSLDRFTSDFIIQPTMCFVDGDHRYEGVKKDLEILSSFLRPGIPVLCHDYLHPENDTGHYGVRRAAFEWETAGYAEFHGVFGCSALFVTTDKCSGKTGGMDPVAFDLRRKKLIASYGLEAGTLRYSVRKILGEIRHAGKRLRDSLFVKGTDKRPTQPANRNTKDEQVPVHYTNTSNCPAWLSTFPVVESYRAISQPAKFAHDETKYDEQYDNNPVDMSVGQGLVNLLRESNVHMSGTALEIGCGTGVLSLGLVKSGGWQNVIITDPSPVFLDITFNKMKRSGIDTSRAHLAVLKAEEIGKLPKNEFSLIALRSTVHHVSNVDNFILDAASSLKPGGALVFQEPCAEGYILMGSIAQFIPLAFKQAGVTLSNQHAKQIETFYDVMRFYARKDVDKSAAEDKHLFRVDELMKVCGTVGMTMDFYPNMTFEHFDKPSKERVNTHSFYSFFYDYLKYCMSFEQPLMDLIDKHFKSYCLQINDIAPLNNPYMHGVFVCSKN